MGSKNKFLQAYNSPKAAAIYLLKHTALLWPGKLYLSLLFRLKMGKWIDWKNPKTFNEKLQWLKLYNRRHEYTAMVDKISAKTVATSLIGPEYIIPTLDSWLTPDDIDFDKLPDQFVLKSTHGGGNTGVVVCKDKSTFDKKAAVKKLKNSLRSDIYRSLREWPYKNVGKSVFAEELIIDKEHPDKAIVDYKFSCFGGHATDVMVCLDRESGDTKFYFFDRDWKLLRINKRGKAAPKDFTIPKPERMDEMFMLADKLSAGTPYMRVDLYCVNNQIYFGEMTFFPQSGMDPNLLPETDLEFGRRIILPNKTR